MNKKSIAGGVLGIVGAAIALIGGFSLALCANIADTIASTSYTWAAYLFGIGGAIVGLIGGILDFSKPIAGGILQIISVAMIVALCIIMYWAILMIIALVLLVLGAILSFALQKAVTK